MQTVTHTTGLCKVYRGRPTVDHLDMQVEQVSSAELEGDRLCITLRLPS